MSDTLITNPNDIRLRNEDDPQQIFGRPPGWTLRYGITVIFVFFTTLAFMGYFIEYPDTVVAPVQITTENPPIAVVARVSGKISDFLVSDGASVEAGQLLVELENTARRSDLDQLKTQLQLAANSTNPVQFLTFDFSPSWQLGTLQTNYANFLQHLQDLEYYLESGHAGRQRRALRKQISELKKLNQSLDLQQSTQQQIKRIAAEKLVRRQQLNNSGDESLEQLETAQERTLRAQRELEDIDNQRITNDLRIAEINTRILNLKQDDSALSNQKWLQIKEDVQQLQREVREWEQMYLAVAPIAGRISLSKSLSAQQFVNEGEEMLSVVPVGSAGQLLAQAQLPIYSSGKVSERDSVNLRLSGYPYQEFGIIRGVVAHIADVPTADGSSYLVQIELPNGLQTTYNRQLNFRQQMQGEAHIITKKRRIVQRIFDPIISAFYNNP